MFLGVIRAILRTNYFQTGPTETASHLSCKLDPSQLRWLPQPRPRFEIFVYSPRTEGVHLRGGAVARGGIRWSDRREDFRTEVLGLMKAQMVKNAVIVPVGAKGGFVVKRPPARRDDLPEEVDRLLPDLHPRAARPHGRHRRRRGRPALGRGALRRRRPLPRRGRRQGHRDLLGHRQRHRARGGLLARRRVRVGRLDGLRPQGDGHHRPRGLGVREAPLPRVRPQRPDRRLHGRGRGRHVRRRVRQRHAAVTPHPARRGVQPPARLPRPEPGRPAELRGAPAPVRAARVLVGRLRPRRDLRRRRRVRPRREVGEPLARGARGARHRGRVAQAERAHPGAPARARGPALERRHRHVREGRRRVTRGRGRQGERRRAGERVGAARKGRRARAATWASPSEAGSSTRSPAGGSTRTRSTTPAGSTAPTAR